MNAKPGTSRQADGSKIVEGESATRRGYEAARRARAQAGCRKSAPVRAVNVVATSRQVRSSPIECRRPDDARTSSMTSAGPRCPSPVPAGPAGTPVHARDAPPAADGARARPSAVTLVVVTVPTATGRRPGRAVVVALPGVALAVAGLFHPHVLAPSTAPQWIGIHLVLLPLFPLLAVALGVLLRGEPGPLAWLARGAAYTYAVLYTALDLLAGVAAGVVTRTVQGGSQAALDLRALGNDLGLIGAAAFLVAAVLVAAVLVRRHGRAALPGAVLLVVGAVPFLTAHVYWPTGGLALLAVAAGSGLLAISSR